MPDILAPGQWETLSLVDSGAVQLSLVSATAARLELSGTASAPKYLGSARDVVAFPVSAVGEGTPVTVHARARSGQPFPGEGVVDLAVDSSTGGQSFLLKGIPVAGQVSAPILQLSRREGALIARPGEGGKATAGLGGWCAKRRAEQGLPVTPTVTELVVDTSSSMRRYIPRVEALERFLGDLCATVEAAPPGLRRAAVAGARANGVGCVEPGGPLAAGGRRVVVTDLPLPGQAGECLVVTGTDLSEALTGRAFTPSAEAWQELERSDAAFTTRTLDAMTPLLEWLILTEPDNGEPR